MINLDMVEKFGYGNTLMQRNMAGAALTRECMAHECAPAEIADMSG